MLIPLQDTEIVTYGALPEWTGQLTCTVCRLGLMFENEVHQAVYHLDKA